jgi:hypothetical protein
MLRARTIARGGDDRQTRRRGQHGGELIAGGTGEEAAAVQP